MGDIHIPSHAVPIGLKDSLVVESFNSLASPAVDVFVRYMDEQGRIHRSGFRHTPSTDRSSATSRFRVGRGHLLSVALEPVGYTPRRGQTFVRAFLTRDDVGVAQPDFPILSDYLVSGSLLAWPGSPLRSSVEGPGFMRFFIGTNPVAGAEAIESVPSGAKWKVHSIRLTIVTSAAAGSRRSGLVFDDGGNIFTAIVTPVTTGPSVSNGLNWVIGIPHETVVGEGNTGLPIDVRLSAGSRIRTSTTNLDVGDDYSAPNMLIEEWLEP